MANGSHASAKGGVTGSDLDVLKPRYSRIVTAIVQGEGGLPAEYFLARLTFQQIYDVAAFVSKYAGKPRPGRADRRALEEGLTTPAGRRPGGSRAVRPDRSVCFRPSGEEGEDTPAARAGAEAA